MKKRFACALALATVMASATAFADSGVTVKYNNEVLSFTQKPIVLNEKTLVQLRPIAEAMRLDIKFASESGNIILSNEKATVIFTENSDKVIVNNKEIKMTVPAVIRNNYTFVPIRDLVEPFGDNISYDDDTKTVVIQSELENISEAVKETIENTAKEPEKPTLVISTGSGKFSSTYFYQSQEDLLLENNGRGYCWVCSYAMLVSDVTGKTVYPNEIAQFNIDKGYGGNYISSHTGILDNYNCKFISALPETSKYFDSFNSSKKRGETTLKITSDEDAENAIKEALDANPKGVLVRYDGYPHTMMAVSYDDEGIYFNDPGIKNGEHITFDKTCLKNFKLSDISSVQAIGVK